MSLERVVGIGNCVAVAFVVGIFCYYVVVVVAVVKVVVIILAPEKTEKNFVKKSPLLKRFNEKI